MCAAHPGHHACKSGVVCLCLAKERGAAVIRTHTHPPMQPLHPLAAHSGSLHTHRFRHLGESRQGRAGRGLIQGLMLEAGPGGLDALSSRHLSDVDAGHVHKS